MGYRLEKWTIDITMVMQFEASKDDTNKELKEVESHLKAENLSLKKQIDKLKNIATNMHKELNMLKSKRSWEMKVEGKLW